MFNVSKKTLSVVLCLALLLSVVAVCFMTPATAKTVTSTEEFITYKDLSKEFTPDVSLTFEGDETTKYGIAYGRWSDGAGYSGGKLSLTSGDYWVFFGKDGSVGKTIVRTDSGGKGTAEEKAAAVANRYTVTTGKTYMLTFDLQGAKDSTVPATIGEIGVNISVDGNAPATSNVSVLAKHNTILEYKIGGVAQAAGTKLTADSDWQTVSYIFQPKVDGACGINPKLGANMHIDNVKIVELDKQWDSSFQNKITFDLGGWEVNRTASAGYAAEENGNKYGVINVTQGGTTFFSNGEYRTNSITSLYNNHTTEDGLAQIATAQSKMFKFVPGETYEITFKYRYDKNYEYTNANYAPVVGKTKLGIRLMADPGGAAHGADDPIQAKSWVKNLTTSGLTLENDPNTEKWQDVKITFTVKEDADIDYASYGYIRAEEGNTIGKEGNGVYFGIRSDNRKIHIDDYEVKEIDLENSKSVSVTTDYVYHDMENDAVATNTTGSIGDKLVMNNSTTVKATFAADANDATRGKVLTMQADRGTFGDTGILVPGKKYYISFDAKGTSDNQALILVIAGLNDNNNNNLTGSYGGARYFISNASGAVPSNGNYPNHWKNASKGFKFYIDGKEVEHNGTNLRLSTKWQHFGIVIDLTDSDVVTAINQIGTSGTNTLLREDKARYFYFGNTGCSFDNFMMVQTSGVEGAVPETDGKVSINKSTEYVWDMDDATTSQLWQNTANTASFVEVEGRGKVLEFSSTASRAAFKDSNIIVPGCKYSISFDARTINDKGKAPQWLILTGRENGASSLGSPRYIFVNNSNNLTNQSTNEAYLKFFKFYIDGKEVIHRANSDNLDLTADWHTFTIEIDYTVGSDFYNVASNANDGVNKDGTPATFIASKAAFYFGTANSQYDNFTITKTETVEVEPKEFTEVSIRKPQVKDEKYLSAGLRFKAQLPTAVAEDAAEIGFVVAPSTHASQTADWYNLEKGLNKIARQGVVKNTALDKNCIYATVGDTTYYQMVITGLSAQDGTNLEAKTAYNRRFSVVLYTKDAEGKYSYYALGESSYYQTIGNNSIFKAQ